VGVAACSSAVQNLPLLPDEIADDAIGNNHLAVDDGSISRDDKPALP
jgi:hypothetical protein